MIPADRPAYPPSPPSGPARYPGTVDIGSRASGKRYKTMHVLSALPTLLIIWAVVTVAFLLLIAYRGQITRYEEDQLFLNGAHSNEENQQNEIIRKVNRLAPFVRLLGGATGVITAGIIGLFIYDAWQKFQ